MKNDLVGVIDGDLQVKVYVQCRVHHRVFTRFDHVLGNLRLPVSTHDHLVSICVDMALAERYWLGKNVIACANQVNKEHFVILDKTEDTFIVIACVYRAESYDDSL